METRRDPWPALSYETSKETLGAIHMWTQIVGKVRLAMTPLMNHWWNSTLFVTPRGLTTSTIPSGDGAFQMDFDFLADELVIATSREGRATVPLGTTSVAGFYRQVLDALRRLGVAVPPIRTVPNEVAQATPFEEDTRVRRYDRNQALGFHSALLSSHIVFERFRAAFLGKASPVQFFWGSFDLAAARFSGRRAPAYAGGKPPHVHIHVMHESYSHELISAGFWPGNDDDPQLEYYAYAMPPPPRLADAHIAPATARWVPERGEFILPYDAVRSAADPATALLDFLQSTYDAAADLAEWDRSLLEERVRCECDPLPAGFLAPRVPVS